MSGGRGCANWGSAETKVVASFNLNIFHIAADRAVRQL